MREDPDSLEPVTELHADRAARLEGELAALRAGSPDGAGPNALGLPEEEQKAHLERLRSLGYVE